MNLGQSEPSAVVVCQGLTYNYDHVRAVDSIDLTVRRGEIVALLGPSGCGKTTTLRLIAGFEAPDAGRVLIEGKLVAGDGHFVPPEKRAVGMVFQDYALFPHLNVARNVAFGLHGTRDRSDRVEYVTRLLSLVGLGGLGGRMPHELSGGQQQRVALARALAPEPAVLLLDEPFSNLDARLRHVVRAEVRDILRRAGTSAIFVTHDQDEALTMADRLAVLNGGRLEQVGAPEAVFERPASRFVADFLGRSDFLTGVIEGGMVRTEIGHIPQASGLADGAEVDVLVRPTDIDIEVIEPDPGGTVARIAERTFQGLNVGYRISLPSGGNVQCLVDRARWLEIDTPVRMDIRPGRNAACYVDGRLAGADDGAILRQ